ncbi:MAG: carbamoyltransferase [Euryarchaeota archaeon]|nr:carbamoyltransferase [Euryarchaeota archaeon]MDE1836408.1 carbamoyltransferase [Euryarchaeota archaeon]MDE1879077.1 carbamoyltransferase [Euryarchaeota archaeon]MDE2044156.1 carbamoyltransferase [Thermoplasmata archaeon]
MGCVIGFSWPTPHDNAVSVLLDGKLVFSSEEERFTRHKHAHLEPPLRAMVAAFRYLRERHGLKPTDVDAFALNYDPSLAPWSMRRDLYFFAAFASTQAALTVPTGQDMPEVVRRTAGGVLGGFRNSALHARIFLRHAFQKAGSLEEPRAPIIPVEHHLAHAASAYYFSGFANAAVLTLDGVGEVDATVLWKVRGGEFEKLGAVPANRGSLGFLYDFVCMQMGFETLEGPGKVMGLAPYGRPTEKGDQSFQGMLEVGSDPLRPYRLVGGHPPRGVSVQKLGRWYRELAGSVVPESVGRWDPRGEVDARAAGLAWSLQHLLEVAVLHLAQLLRERSGESDLALAGGVALNAKANMEVYYAKIFHDLFVFPAASDSGATAGAAAWVAHHHLGERIPQERIRTIYLGPEYDEAAVKRAAERGKWTASFVGDDVAPLADLVAKGGVITFYQGRAELGPRALGNRSIVADPRNAATWKALNAIKGREWWRPLAPSLLESRLQDYFESPVPHPFMVLMLRLKQEASTRVPAVAHVDRTARPQSVRPEDNPRWYALLRAFEERTGEGLVVNTSFNLAGEPLVETPEEAIRSFALGGFDALYLQGWLIRKRSA